LKRQVISFFFDHSTDQQWKDAVHDAYRSRSKINTRFKSIAFANLSLKERVAVRDEEFLPLQAADLVAYRMRQKMEKLANLDFAGPEWNGLDDILFKSMNKANARLSASERDAVLRRVFDVPESATYEQAMDAIVNQSNFKK
jgi:hypothetical protein